MELSLIHTTKTIREIFNSKGKILFIYPANTTLDNIYPDLWINIINMYHPFVVGKYNLQYPGYRLVTDKDFFKQENKNNFVNYCKKNNGLISVDYIKTGVLYFDRKSVIVFDKYCLVCNGSDKGNMKKGIKCSFSTILKDHEEIIEIIRSDFYVGTNSDIITHQRSKPYPGLFIFDT